MYLFVGNLSIHLSVLLFISINLSSFFLLIYLSIRLPVYLKPSIKIFRVYLFMSDTV